jgi:hypothetical protein
MAFSWTSQRSRPSNVGLLYHNPILAKCGGEAQHLGKVGDLESSGTLECSEPDSKGQNTSHWIVLGVTRKVLKRRYRKWPRIGHLDICSPSYGQKKGQEIDLFPTFDSSVRHGSGKILTRATTSV